MGWLIGVDVGGTFTDFYALHESDGREVVHKTPSTPADPASAILNGLATLSEDFGISLAEVRRLAHGTTIGTNALIQRKGKPVGVVTTRGFRDLLEIGRQIRPRLYDLRTDNPAPLAPRKHRFEVEERIGPSGEILTPLDAESLAAVIEAVRSSGVEACAVCLLFAFLNGRHEQQVATEIAKALPQLQISLSSEVQPEFREYERFSTTLLNAYLQPVVSRYLRVLEEQLTGRVPHASVGINQSSGGLMSVKRAQRFPIRTALSGPAAGAIGALHAARLCGRPNVITLDMGGTSADVCLIRAHQAGTGFSRKVADFPVRLPMIDINTVGAGGGSIAWFDRDGLLKVGPASAGAEPGPACYGLGGNDPTVTDANVALGRLSPRGLLGGTLALDVDAAKRSLAPIAERLGYCVERSAHGVLGIVTANMVRAIRAVSVERGHDPRDFSLMPFGGAGALHADGVARELGITEILVPAAPGILCAMGLVVSDLKEDFVRSARLTVTGANHAAMRKLVDALAEDARDWGNSEGIEDGDLRREYSFDMRYVGQNFELSVPLAMQTPDELPDADQLVALFGEIHERSYGYANPEDPVEVVNLRLIARAPLGQPPERDFGRADGAARPAATRQVWFDANAAADTPVYERACLLPGHVIEGPAVIEQLDATTVVAPGARACVDGSLNIIIEVKS
ncbi:MAG: hydantoinase/oxoprolinase family protein [Gammaproteobacteria bacterium]|nr:hydantoinase/oxoprolinase family protein [Gammaproteobacteria bacterium]